MPRGMCVHVCVHMRVCVCVCCILVCVSVGSCLETKVFIGNLSGMWSHDERESINYQQNSYLTEIGLHALDHASRTP